MKLAIDVSRWQEAKPFKDKNNITGAAVRSSDGIYKDPYFYDNINQYKEFPIAIYHYFRNNWNVELQVKTFVERVQKAEKILGYKPKIVMDWEDHEGLSIVGKNKAITRGYQWATEVEKALDREIMLYTSKYRFEEMFTKFMRLKYRKIFNYFTSKRLWFAWYFSNDVLSIEEYTEKLNLIKSGWTPWKDNRNVLPVGFSKVDIWQFGQTDTILQGANVDVNVVYDTWLFEMENEISPPSTSPPTLEERVTILEKKVSECCEE